MNGRSRNLPLALGTSMLALVAFVAIFGPALAPRDPTDVTYVLNLGGRFIRPPFPAFATGEFPLGSDVFGRDTLSQLLWAVRPTLTLMLLVLAARLIAGVTLGVIAGWSIGRLGRAIDGLISLALAVPVLIVALAVTALLQNRLGVIAFVIGLSITGWAEVARVVREQTNLIKGQQYIEAARALGMGDLHIALRHVWRQLTQILVLTAAFEAAGVLLTLAALGFLGYYVGGSNWIMVGDFAARRIAGLPELGQMVASAATNGPLTSITGMLLVGTAVAFIVAAFTLVGEGLRARMAQESRRRSQLYESVAGFMEEQRVEQRVYDALAQRKTRRRLALGAGVLGLAVLAGLAWYAMRPAAVAPVVDVPGGHAWSGDRRDPEGTLRAAATLAGADAPLLVWTFDAGADLTGGPAVASDGTIYIASADRVLHAIDPSGNPRWQVPLAARPIGAPGIAPDGGVLVVDEDGGLSRVSPQGAPEWHRELDSPATAISGPVVDADGNIYYAVEGAVVSRSPDGEPRWRGNTLYTYFSPVPRLKRDSGDLFFKDVVLSALDGSTVLGETVDPLDQFITGEDGRMYLQSEGSLLEWRTSEQGAALVEVAKLDYTKRYPGIAVQDGSVLADGSAWLLLGNEFVPGRLVWFRPGGELLGSLNFPLRNSRVVAAGRDNTLYTCGLGQSAACVAVGFATDRPQWQVELPDSRAPVGGALVDGRLYVTTASGKLFALGTP